MSAIEQAQYMLDHPLEHVHPDAYRKIIAELLELIWERRHEH